MNPLVLLAPLFLVFEVWQLVICERYLGIKQIKANLDPRSLPMRESLAAVWSISFLVYLAWMLSLLLHPFGRAQGLVLLAVTAIGYAARSSCGLKWVLVLLTFEGSIRVGMLLSLCGMAARRLLM
ncbi:MAG: hypothetical protein PHQ04_01365 [Opitutaceae bacterium]|nr:hypothetical protein [Opitutaceae bacterium]